VNLGEHSTREACVCGSKQYIKRDNSPTLQYFFSSIRWPQLGRVTQISPAAVIKAYGEVKCHEIWFPTLSLYLAFRCMFVCTKNIPCLGNLGASNIKRDEMLCREAVMPVWISRGEHLALKSNNIHPPTNRNSISTLHKKHF
jgi:hypothetical protein